MRIFRAESDKLDIKILIRCEPCILFISLQIGSLFKLVMGAQWLSGRVLDTRLRGCSFEPHRCHCVMSLSKTHESLLSTGSTQGDLPNITEKLSTGTEKIKQTNSNW